VAELVDAQG